MHFHYTSLHFISLQLCVVDEFDVAVVAHVVAGILLLLLLSA